MENPLRIVAARAFKPFNTQHYYQQPVAHAQPFMVQAKPTIRVPTLMLTTPEGDVITSEVEIARQCRRRRATAPTIDKSFLYAPKNTGKAPRKSNKGNKTNIAKSKEPAAVFKPVVKRQAAVRAPLITSQVDKLCLALSSLHISRESSNACLIPSAARSIIPSSMSVNISIASLQPLSAAQAITPPLMDYDIEEYPIL